MITQRPCLAGGAPPAVRPTTCGRAVGKAIHTHSLVQGGRWQLRSSSAGGSARPARAPAARRYTPPDCASPAPAQTQAQTQAVVIGAGLAGLTAARALSGSFDRVVVLERDDLAAAQRPGVPQYSQTHVLLTRGLQVCAWQPWGIVLAGWEGPATMNCAPPAVDGECCPRPPPQALEELLPGFSASLRIAGAHDACYTADFYFFDYKREYEGGPSDLRCAGPLPRLTCRAQGLGGASRGAGCAADPTGLPHDSSGTHCSAPTPAPARRTLLSTRGLVERTARALVERTPGVELRPAARVAGLQFEAGGKCVTGKLKLLRFGA